MRRLLLVVVTAALAAATFLAPQGAHAIVYGEPDNGHRNVGSFITEVDVGGGSTVLVQLCTGTLVDADVVLSAAHCFSGSPPEFGQTWFTLDPVIDADRDGMVDAGLDLRTGTAVPHPRFSWKQANPFDIAVFELDRPVTGVSPAKLPDVGLLNERGVHDRVFTAVGYGATRETNHTGPQGIGAGWRRMKAEQEMLSLTRAWVTFWMNRATGNGGTCYGDSGGPHFLGDTVVSLTVTGDAMCKATDKSYRIDTPWAQDFLDDFVDLS